MEYVIYWAYDIIYTRLRRCQQAHYVSIGVSGKPHIKKITDGLILTADCLASDRVYEYLELQLFNILGGGSE